MTFPRSVPSPEQPGSDDGCDPPEGVPDEPVRDSDEPQPPPPTSDKNTKVPSHSKPEVSLLYLQGMYRLSCDHRSTYFPSEKLTTLPSPSTGSYGTEALYQRPRKRSTLVNVPVGSPFSSTSHLQASDKFGYGILPTRNGRPYAPSMLWTWTALKENYLWVRKTCQSLPGVPMVRKEVKKVQVLAVRALFNTYLLSHDRSTLPMYCDENKRKMRETKNMLRLRKQVPTTTHPKWSATQSVM